VKRGGESAGVDEAAGESLWRHGDFMRLWSAETVSQLGTQITLLAMPLAAVLVLHASTFEVGLLTALELLPFLLVGLPAGVWVDRLPRRSVLVVADVGRSAALCSIPIAHALGALTMLHLYVVVLLTGVLTVFFDVAYQSYLPALVARRRLIEGNAKLETSRAGAQLGGPAIAGWLIGLIGAPSAIAGDAASFLGSAALVLGIHARQPERAHGALGAGTRPKMRSEIGAGLRFVLGHVHLRAIAACTATSNLFDSMLRAVFVVYAVRSLGLSAATIGLVFALGNVGYLLAALVSRSVNRRFELGPTIITSIAIWAPGAFLIVLAPRDAPVPFLVAGFFLEAFGSVVYNVAQVSYRQAITPDEMLGRMNATMRFVVWGTMPIGSLLGGVLGSELGLRPTIWIAAAGGVTSLLPVVFSPVRSLERIPEPVTQPPVWTSGEP